MGSSIKNMDTHRSDTCSWPLGLAIGLGGTVYQSVSKKRSGELPSEREELCGHIWKCSIAVLDTSPAVLVR